MNKIKISNIFFALFKKKSPSLRDGDSPRPTAAVNLTLTPRDPLRGSRATEFLADIGVAHLSPSKPQIIREPRRTAGVVRSL